MFDDLQTFLENIIGHDSTQEIMSMLYLFDLLGYEDHIFPIRFAMDAVDNKPSDGLVNDIRSIINDNAVLIAKTMGIYLVKEPTDLTTLYAILFTLSTLENYEDKDSILAILDTAGSAEEVLSDCVQLVYGTDWALVLPNLEKVSSDFTDRLKEISKVVVTADAAPMYVDKTVYKERCRLYFAVKQNTYIRQLIADGYSLGTPTELFIKALEEHYAESDPTSEQLAVEILGATLAGDEATGLESVLAIARKYTEHLVTDPQQTIAVNDLMQRYFTEVYGEKR